MEIEGEELTINHHARVVVYVPDHADGDVAHPDAKIGAIASFNRSYVFVMYESSRQPEATCPENLRWARVPQEKK